MTDWTYDLIHADCLAALSEMDDDSVDSIVTDPPYGLAFMGKRWDYDVPSVEIWAECLRVLKPGGHLLAFAGTRTQHRMAVRIEDAGFEIRDMIAWVYGSGFPKSHNVANSIDKLHGAENRGHAIASGSKYHPTTGEARASGEHLPAYKARTEAGHGWEGWGTALKPALEPITVARKPLVGTVAANVMTHGTGALNIDGCRVGYASADDKPSPVYGGRKGEANGGKYGNSGDYLSKVSEVGRWPANLIHDGSDEVTGLFPGEDTGSAARFFYCAKASKRDRDEGLEHFPAVRTGGMQATADGSMLTGSGNERTTTRANHHPTVKPTDLMRYLCRLVTPPGGLVLDPFMGSGSTGKAAMLEGFRFIGVEREESYMDIAEARIEAARQETLK